MTHSESRVIKLGGSLLDWPCWVEQFRRWRSLQPPAADVLVVGGGALVDWVRELDRAQALLPEAAHWLAVRGMGLTAAIAARELSEATLVHSLAEVHCAPAIGIRILDTEEMLRQEVGQADALPCNWDVTSDSIAARVAMRICARELVLLKSSLPKSSDHEAWAAEGYVDAHFPLAAHGLNVRCINLRDPKLGELATRSLATPAISEQQDPKRAADKQHN